MSDFIRREGLLPASETDAIERDAPLDLIRFQDVAASIPLEERPTMRDWLGRAIRSGARVRIDGPSLEGSSPSLRHRLGEIEGITPVLKLGPSRRMWSVGSHGGSMRAIAHRKPGPLDADGSLADIDLPDPVPGPGDLLVRVRAVSVNPADVKVRAGAPLGSGADWRVLGFDGAGEIAAVGDGVADFSVGDGVFFVADGFDRGSNAELVVVVARMAARKPGTFDWAEAAALPVAVGTAWESLFERMEVTRPVPGAAPAILVVNGAGGVGSAAIQLLRARTDLTVIASASRPETQDWVRALGAHHVVNHREAMAPQVAALGIGRPGFILSTSHTDDHLADLVELIAPQGRIGAIDDPATLDVVALKDKSLSFHWEYLLTRSKHGTPDVAALGELLEAAAALVDAGQLRGIVTRQLTPISAATLMEAHRLVEGGAVHGKVVLAGW